MSLRDKLSRPLHKSDVADLATEVNRCGLEGELYALVFDSDKRTSDNAAWVMTYAELDRLTPLSRYRDALITEAMNTTSVTKCRLLLHVIERTWWREPVNRPDFLNFCLNTAANPTATTGVRSYCLRQAYRQCLPYPELRRELTLILDLIRQEPCPTGLRSVMWHMEEWMEEG